jgi:hypothetical protein
MRMTAAAAVAVAHRKTGEVIFHKKKKKTASSLEPGGVM